MNISLAVVPRAPSRLITAKATAPRWLGSPSEKVIPLATSARVRGYSGLGLKMSSSRATTTERLNPQTRKAISFSRASYRLNHSTEPMTMKMIMAQAIVELFSTALMGMTLVNRPAVAAMMPPTVTTESV